MNYENQIVTSVIDEVKICLTAGDPGHDWWHMHRVANLAVRIAMHENAMHENAMHEKVNLFVVQLGAWLHDIADWKFHKGDEEIGPKIAKEILQKYNVSENVIDQVCDIIETISFKGAGVTTSMKTIEGKIVQDADRLDALGAIGIARTFVYGGFKNNPMHVPEQKALLHATKEEYMKSQGSVINHFYEKLLLLKDRMNTKAGKIIAQKRHDVMQQYLQQFFTEWDCNDFNAFDIDVYNKNLTETRV